MPPVKGEEKPGAGPEVAPQIFTPPAEKQAISLPPVEEKPAPAAPKVKAVTATTVKAAPVKAVAVKTVDYEAISLANLLAIWGVDMYAELDSWQRGDDSKLKYEEIARRYGLNTVFLTADLPELSIMNLPCILSQVKDSQLNQKLSLVLTGLSEKGALVIHPEAGEKIYSKADLASRWSGEIIVLWRNIDKLGLQPISPWLNHEEIGKIENRLRQLGYFKDYPSPDKTIRKKQQARALMNFQHDHRLKVDGIVGIRTRLVLYNIIDQPFTPTLKREVF
jgi:hypothetical protein